MKRVTHLLMLSGYVLLGCDAAVTVFLDGSINSTTFTATRYSDFIGDFDRECAIDAPATFLTSDENPCDLATITRELTGLAVILSFAFDNIKCFEETAYDNLEELGVVAVLNTDPQPPGATLNKMNWGNRPNTGFIPLLDLGLDFFNEVYLIAPDTDQTVEVSISGCADENKLGHCINAVQTWLIISITLPTLYIAKSCKNGLGNLKYSEGTAPRIYILRFILGVQVFAFFTLITDAAAIDGYFWPANGKLYTGLKGIICGIIPSGIFYITLVATYYWRFLETRCFHSYDNMSNNWFQSLMGYNRSLGFFSRIGFHTINCLCLALTGGFLKLLLVLHPDMAKVYNIFNYLDLALMSLLLYANYHFISEATSLMKPKLLPDATGSSSRNLSRFLEQIMDNLTGRGLQKYFTVMPPEQLDQLSVSTMRLTLHLGYWLQVYAVLLVCLTFVISYLIEFWSSFGRFEDDPIVENCWFLIPQYLAMLLRTIMVIPIVEGIKGPVDGVPSNKEATLKTSSDTNEPPNEVEDHSRVPFKMQ